MQAPTYDDEHGVLRVPRVPGVKFLVDGNPVRSTVKIDKPFVVNAEPIPPTVFRDGIETEWAFGDSFEPSDSSDEEDDEEGGESEE